MQWTVRTMRMVCNVHADSAVNYARQEVSLPPNFDQSADVYRRAFIFHPQACYLSCWMSGTLLTSQQHWTAFWVK